MTNAVKMLNYANNQVKPTLLVLISQARNNIGAMYVSQQPTGGMATKFYSSTIVKLFSSESDNQAIKGKIYVGDKIIEEKVGRKVRWDVQFSKTSPAFQSGEYDFYFRGADLGVDTIADLVDTAEMLGFVERAGAWYTVEGERYQGRDKLVLGVKENLDIQEALIKKVNNESV
jgi:recombination protein RecA